MISLQGATIGMLSRALREGSLTSLELTRAYLDRIAHIEPTVHAFITVDANGALIAAAESDERRRQGQIRGILDGIPYAVKDNYCTRGLRTTCASRMLEGYIPPYDATVISRLRAAGCVLLGKLNMDEFAMGSSTRDSAFGMTRNPLDLGRVAGGSSGGSAAAVAAREVPFSLGSDTGGSVRQPAAFCGVYGLRPTWGRISRYGMTEFASSFDTVGIVTNSPDDCRILLSALEGRDGMDCTVSDKIPALDGINRPLRVAVLDVPFGGVISKEVQKSVSTALNYVQKWRWETENVRLPDPLGALAAYCVLTAVEAASNLGRFDGTRYRVSGVARESERDLYEETRRAGFGKEVKRRVLFGVYVSSGMGEDGLYRRADRMRRLITARMDELFQQYDLLISPTAPTGAFPIDKEQSEAERRQADLLSVYAGFGGFPALSLPMGSDENGLPLGLQLTGARGSENRLLTVAERLREAERGTL